jgi:hypothetical protein
MAIDVGICLQYMQFGKHEFVADTIAGYLQFRLICYYLDAPQSLEPK